jgi:hypothetical protein
MFSTLLARRDVVLRLKLGRFRTSSAPTIASINRDVVADEGRKRLRNRFLALPLILVSI